MRWAGLGAAVMVAAVLVGCGPLGRPQHAASPVVAGASLAPIGPVAEAPAPPPDGGVPELIGRWYTVQPGDSVSQIAGRHGVPIEDIVELNGLVDPARIEVGRRLFLYGVAEIIRRNRRPVFQGAARPSAPPGAGEPAGALLAWPVKSGRVSSKFGPRWGRMHKGLDIAGSVGTPVLAAAEGVVIFSDSTDGGYGNLVIIQHAGELVTVYAHNRRNVVDEGVAVRQGAKIAELGNTGKSTGPHLHFEVRFGRTAKDPLKFLPNR